MKNPHLKLEALNDTPVNLDTVTAGFRLHDVCQSDAGQRPDPQAIV